MKFRSKNNNEITGEEVYSLPIALHFASLPDATMLRIRNSFQVGLVSYCNMKNKMLSRLTDMPIYIESIFFLRYMALNLLKRDI